MPVDGAIATRAGVLLANARGSGFQPKTEDSWIAATAEIHGMEVVTYNAADFRPLGVTFHNPSDELPPDA